MEDFVAHVYIISILIGVINSNGQFYVGFLGYANVKNLGFYGTCCDGEIDNEQCSDYCDLLFEVSVGGIDSAPSTGKRPSETPIDNNNAVLFPSSYEGVVNPLTFDFQKWPGAVNVTVDIYDKDTNDTGEGTLELVDTFLFTFKHNGPSLDFIYKKKYGQRKTNPSELRMVFRYECDPSYYGQDCFTDCLVHPNANECPTYPFSSGHSTKSMDWLFLLTTPKTTTQNKCKVTRNPPKLANVHGTVQFSNPPLCRNDTIKTGNNSDSSVTSSGSSMEYNSTSSPLISVDDSTQTSSTDKTTSTHKITTSNFKSSFTSPYITSSDGLSRFSTTSAVALNVSSDKMDSENDTDLSIKQSTNQSYQTLRTEPSLVSSRKNIISESETTTSPYVTKDINGASLKFHNIPFKTTTETDDVNSNHVDSNSNVNSTDQRSVINNALVHHSSDEYTSSGMTPSLPSPSLDPSLINDDSGSDSMGYWPAILGGVLGLLAIIAAIAVIVFYRKQKAAQKRQDIYNVNPKRWALEPHENGTTGKSEVALETEQV